MPTPTYDLIATTTLDSSSSTVSFTNIPSTYRDLVLTGQGTFNDNAIPVFTLNSIQSNAGVRIYNYLDNAVGNNFPNDNYIWSPVGTSRPNFRFMLQVFDYSVTNKRKPFLLRSADDLSAGLAAGTSQTTNAITSIQILQNSSWSYQAGSIFHLFGIAG